MDRTFNPRNHYLKECFDPLDQLTTHLSSGRNIRNFECGSSKAGVLITYLAQFKSSIAQSFPEQPLNSISGCSPLLFCQSMKKWENPRHKYPTLSNPANLIANASSTFGSSSPLPTHSSFFGTPTHVPDSHHHYSGDPSCAHNSLLSAGLSQHGKY